MAVTNDLETDQRVHRSCMALTEAGYEVVLIGRMLPKSKPLSRPYKTYRMRLIFSRKAVFYAEFNVRLLLKMLWLKADLVYANDTDTLLGCYWASRLKRKPLMMDAHELFCEVPELVGRERVKRFWQRIEDKLMPRLDGACTVSAPIAEIYRERYGVDFAVVRNVPMRQAVAAKVARPSAEKRMLLYQGAVNVGRGVDWMIDAMEYLPQCRFVVAGDGDQLESMKQKAASLPWGSRVEFKGRLAPEELRRLTVSADLGISLLANLGKNYYYSLPNRIADFVQARVPVLATNFPEIGKVVETYGIGRLVDSHEPREIAAAIESALSEWEDMDPEKKTAIFDRAAADLSWDHDKKTLLKVVDATFE